MYSVKRLAKGLAERSRRIRKRAVIAGQSNKTKHKGEKVKCVPERGGGRAAGLDMVTRVSGGLLQPDSFVLESSVFQCRDERNIRVMIFGELKYFGKIVTAVLLKAQE